MLLTVTALVKIVDDGLAVSRGEIFGPYPSYKYFIALFEQYNPTTKSVLSSTFLPLD